MILLKSALRITARDGGKASELKNDKWKNMGKTGYVADTAKRINLEACILISICIWATEKIHNIHQIP